MKKNKELTRCPWHTNDPLYIRYHDEEWGVPVHDERKLLAKLILDGAQAGLSWITILKKRENYWAAFDNFDAEKMARYDDEKIAELMGNAGIVRNRQKINSAIKNAQAYLRLREELGSFDEYLWGFVGGKPIVNTIQSEEDYMATSPESHAMSKDLKIRGFSFVGPTICYAFMQAVGMVNDHMVSCFRYEEVMKNILNE
ncbi:MAG: DNA-3-methyladenine glycosylase I [Anaerolineae bacterium]|jgi:DNA-3-methyladenine glycosylase I|nr:DNA-3-methyladenine glycosylase I [Anaerolineae bacterium]MBT3713887.1 DNA-3-methyladenine glycosylase I [Anaerolineae bacterium]MBT4311646.1 DNA-3-methyladenine glycosylase I [Anaerolineae bacterium]MBT4459809.1 DNA-3-methyladenine glycosylase I [Anaerolineae bacterium]MBT4843138.1 DNA-3-methyladenine glycosylase I [Anaerolineae bacterium]